MQSSIVVIGICAPDDTQMLRDILDCATRQVEPPGVSVCIVAADDRGTADRQSVIDEFKAAVHPITYIRSTAAPIDAVVQKARELRADRVAFLAESADADWLAQKLHLIDVMG